MSQTFADLVTFCFLNDCFINPVIEVVLLKEKYGLFYSVIIWKLNLILMD